MFLGLLDPDPDPLVRGMDSDPDTLVRGLDPDPDPSNISNISKKNLDFSCFVTPFYRILRNYDVMTS